MFLIIITQSITNKIVKYDVGMFQRVIFLETIHCLQ